MCQAQHRLIQELVTHYPAGTLAELDVRIYWHGGDGWVEEMQKKAKLIELTSTRKLVTQQLGLFTKLDVAAAGSWVELQLKIYWHGGWGGWMDEMQNKAEAQPAWAGSWAQLSLAIIHL